VSIGYWESWDTVCNRIAKTEGKQHEDRDVQFQHINETVEQFQQQQTVISVDAKKKELIGAYKNAGVEWQPRTRSRQTT